ncbi:MAG: hypothetical protein LBT46_05600 [Planctomycetaceae bacterium]|nr:hypothetical protein [Planctomycetaceae bacterium]
MPNRYGNLMKLDDAAFRHIIETKRFVFGKMLVIVLFLFSASSKGSKPYRTPAVSSFLRCLR